MLLAGFAILIGSIVGQSSLNPIPSQVLFYFFYLFVFCFLLLFSFLFLFYLFFLLFVCFCNLYSRNYCLSLDL